MVDLTKVSSPDRDATHAIDAYVAGKARVLVNAANDKNIALAAELKVAVAEHAGAEEEIARLRRELNGRPTSKELEDAQARASELSARVEELEAELEARPSSPDQLVELVRQSLDPMFDELRQMVENMEPKSPEPAASTDSTEDAVDATFEEVEKGGETKPEAA